MSEDKEIELYRRDYGHDVLIELEHYPYDKQNVGIIFIGTDGYHRFVPITRMPLTCRMLRYIALELAALNTDNVEEKGKC